MKTVLVSMLQEHGHLNPSFRISRALKQRGYDVRYLGIPDFEDAIVGQGFGFVPFLPELYPRGYSEQREQLAWFARRRAITRQFNLVIERLLDSSGPAAMLGRIAPSVMIVDINHTVLAYLARRLGIPTVSMNVTLPQTKDAGVPPLRTGARYQPGLRGRVASEIRWHGFLATRKLLALAAQPFGLCPPYELAARAARRFGYPRERLDCNTVYMPRLDDIPELVLCPEAFDFPRPPRPGRHFVESVDVERKEPAFSWGRIDAAKPLVYVSMGSQHLRSRAAKRFLAVAMAALATRPQWQAIVTLGRYLGDPELPECAPNIVAVRSAPQLAVLKRATVMVTHGGLGSVKESVLRAVPMAVFPLAVDQRGNAARVEHHGVGLRGEPSSVSAGALLAMVETLIGNAAIRARTAALARRFEQTEGACAGADLVERCLTGGGWPYSTAAQSPHLA